MYSFNNSNYQKSFSLKLPKWIDFRGIYVPEHISLYTKHKLNEVNKFKEKVRKRLTSL